MGDEKKKRRILREQISKGIRFPIMDEKDFAGVVLDNKILTREDIVSVLKLRNSVPSPPKDFEKLKDQVLTVTFNDAVDLTRYQIAD